MAAGGGADRGGKKGGKKSPSKARRGAAASSGPSRSSRSRSRKTSSSKRSGSVAAAASSASSSSAGSALSPTLQLASAGVIPPAPSGPTPTLILDTGGWTVKHGIVTVTPSAVAPVAVDVALSTTAELLEASSPTTRPNQSQPRESPNATARLRHQLAVLSADELFSVRNQSQLEVTRPLERGYVADLGSQLRVWKRVCDIEGIGSAPSPAGGPIDPAVAALLGIAGAAGSAAAKKRRRAAAAAAGAGPSMSPPPPTCASRDCAALLLTQPFTPQSVLDRVDEVWFRDLGFARVGRRLVQTMAAYRYLSALGRKRRRAEEGGVRKSSADGGGGIHISGKGPPVDEGTDGDDDLPPWDDDLTECCIVIDSGFSLTHVVPTISSRAVSCGIRRVNVGGKFLTNLLKEAVSYRQWNMMDEFHIVNEAKEALCYVSQNFDAEMKSAAAVRAGFREFDRDFVLPDFVDSFKGEVRLTEPLRKMKEMREREEAAKAEKMNEAGTGEGGSKRLGKDGAEEKTKNVEGDGSKEDTEGVKDGREDSEEDSDGGDARADEAVDSDEETDEQRRFRILRQREEERRRREAEEAERQVLSLSVERFAVSEALFRPTDVGLEQGGIAEAVVQAVEACDPTIRAALLHNVLVVGGNARMPGFLERLEREVRALAPAGYEVRLWRPDDPVEYAWKGAREFATVVDQDVFRTCCVDRVEWEASQRNPKEMWNVWAKFEERHAVEGMMIM